MSDDEEMTARQRRTRRGARNKKKNMRRKIDLRDVEAELRSARHDERTLGMGQRTSDQPDASLFVIDTATSATTAARSESAPARPRSRKDRAAAKQLRSLAELDGASRTRGVRPVTNRKRSAQATGASEAATIKRHRSKAAAAPATQAEVAAQDEAEPALTEEEAAGRVALLAVPTATTVWDVQSAQAHREPSPDPDDWTAPLRPRPARKPASVHRPEESVHPAVELPAPGASYNPSFDDHQQLLAAEHNREVNKLETREKSRKEAPAMLSAKRVGQLWLEEMSVGIDDFMNLGASKDGQRIIPGGAESDEDSGEDGADPAGAAATSTRSQNRKTAAARRREQQAKLEEKARKMAKSERLRMQEIYRLRSLSRELTTEEKERQRKQEERQKRAETKRKEQPRRMGRHKFEEPVKEIKLTEELTGSVRKLKPEGNIFNDRFASLQKRNIIEARRPTSLRRRYKLKTYEQRSYKNFDQQEKELAELKEKHKIKTAKRKAKASSKKD